MFASLCFFSTIPSSYLIVGLAIIGNLLFGFLTLEKTCWSPPQIWFNFKRVASSLSTNTSRKFVVADKPFADFFQHLSFIWPKPKQNEHFRPQLLVLCPLSHSTHFGLVLVSLGYAKGSKFFKEYQNNVMLSPFLYSVP